MNFFEWRNAPKAHYAVIGDPISQSRSPEMHLRALDAIGREEVYIRVRIPADEVVPAIEHLTQLGFAGLNVTTPLKGEVLNLPFVFDHEAIRAGAANTLDLKRRRGTNTDGLGFVATLRRAGVTPEHRILVLGAGGAARGVAFAMVDAGYRLDIWNRSAASAESLAEALGSSVGVMSRIEVSGRDVLINATSIGLGDSQLPVDWTGKPGLAIDLTYGKQTVFLVDAERHGWRTQDGREMLAAQGALSLGYWLEQPVSLDLMRTALGLGD